MVLKRKRSESELSFSSAVSTPQRPGSDQRFDFAALSTVISPTSRGLFTRSSRSSTSSQLDSRTMKRFRDNRPPELEIHRRTLNLLYSAQQHQQHQQQHPQPLGQPQLSPSEPVAMAPALSNSTAHTHRTNQQRSLHSFWNIPSARIPVIVETTPSPGMSRSVLGISNSCEDCGAGLGDGDGDEVMMDVDSFSLEGGDHSCGACGKTVCFGCSVSNLGENRRCLTCAGRRTGVEEMGWKAPGVGVC